MIRLDLQLAFHFVFGKSGIHLDDLGDHRRACHSHGHTLEAGSGPGQRAREGQPHALEVSDVLFDHRADGQRLDRISLDPEAFALTAQFQKLYRGRADIDSEERTGFFVEESWHYQFPMTFRELRTLQCPLRSIHPS
ncbi:hypothetical protein D3C85_1114680 [compost metagenome]